MFLLESKKIESPWRAVGERVPRALQDFVSQSPWRELHSRPPPHWKPSKFEFTKVAL